MESGTRVIKTKDPIRFKVTEPCEFWIHSSPILYKGRTVSAVRCVIHAPHCVRIEDQETTTAFPAC